MRSKHLFSILLTTWVAVPSAILFLSAGLARAQTRSANYNTVHLRNFRVFCAAEDKYSLWLERLPVCR